MKLNTMTLRLFLYYFSSWFFLSQSRFTIIITNPIDL